MRQRTRTKPKPKPLLSRTATHRGQYLLACQNMLTRHLDGIMRGTLRKAAQDFVKSHS